MVREFINNEQEFVQQIIDFVRENKDATPTI